MGHITDSNYISNKQTDMKENQPIGKLVVDAQGTEKEIYPRTSFPDKKQVTLNPQEFEEAVQRISSLKENASVGQKEAIWQPILDKPNKPFTFLFLTDVHYLSTKIEYALLEKFLTTVRETPNMALVTGGDDCDNFNVQLGKAATGVYEDPFEAGFQARAWRQRIGELDKLGKVGFMTFGNHTEWSYKGGIDWSDTFLGDMNCPILTSGGLVHLKVGEQNYDVAVTHKYWGTSKLNPTNACKRFLEHEYPEADIVLLGHTHQSENLQFERGGKDRIGIIGGTLKLYDDFARKHGIGGRAGYPGHTVTVWPDRNRMTSNKFFDIAVQDHINRLN